LIKYKRQAWKSFEKISQDEAARLYCYFIDQFRDLVQNSNGKVVSKDLGGVGSFVSTL
jgi:hypothetical protein